MLWRSYGTDALTHRENQELVSQQLVRRCEVVHPHQGRLELRGERGGERYGRQASGVREGPRASDQSPWALKLENQERGPVRSRESRTFVCVGQPACPVATSNSDASMRRAAPAIEGRIPRRNQAPVRASPSTRRLRSAVPVSEMGLVRMLGCLFGSRSTEAITKAAAVGGGQFYSQPSAGLSITISGATDGTECDPLSYPHT